MSARQQNSFSLKTQIGLFRASENTHERFIRNFFKEREENAAETSKRKKEKKQEKKKKNILHGRKGTKEKAAATK